MRPTLIGFVLVSAATLSASDNELNLIVSKQMTRDYSAANITTEQPVGISLRYGRDLVGLGPAQLQLQAGYHAQTTADIEQNGSTGEMKNTGYSLGLQAQWRMGVVLGAGAELRAEKLKMAGMESTTQVRPWITGRVGFSMPLPLVQPVFGLEVALPVTNKSGDANNDEDLLKRLSPNFEVSVYGGIRF
ncbi:hypothetical protein [Holophaga foetida]|uniref:hypothetical protein n=1 Tax=Holophaga foetida TaxID=35839 RepID=UPI0002474A0F|nr:hypothetical protein [Holophaga foetida]